MSKRHVDVVAGVLRDARGRVLLTRRTEGRDFAGRWEFPGGKRKASESPDEALVRELREELGIEARVGAHVITVPQEYPDKRLRLEVREIDDWDGAPRGREQQALVWVPPEKLDRYTMPPADVPVVAALGQPPLYLVTPLPGEDDGRWLAGLDAALKTGIERVQVRVPGLAPERIRALASAVARRCRKAGVECLLNGDIALARLLGTGVHLTAAQLGELDERPLPGSVPVGASCHDLAELRQAEALGCDFAVLGAVRQTPSHPGVVGIGWAGFAQLREQVSLPIYAIGGLGLDDLDAARRHGAQGIAAIRSLWPVTA